MTNSALWVSDNVRGVACVCEVKGDGAFFIRTGRKSYVLSMKYMDMENNNVFVSKNYQIHYNEE